MGKVVIHAGMPKTGSSSIQGWLRESHPRLRSESNVTPIRIRVNPEGEARLVVNDEQKLVNAGKLVALYESRPDSRREVVADFVARLDRKASSFDVVVLSAERFADWFWRRDELFVGELDRLGADHEVVIAYYVRPQHTALEAAWRQWGFRRPEPPSQFLRTRSEQLSYLDTLRFMRDAAPRIRFSPRPFRRDLLVDGDVVADFARVFLGLEVEVGDDPEAWRNRGLPLSLVNALHGAPAGLLWEEDVAEQVNPVLERLRRFVAAAGLPEDEDDDLRLSRLVLQQACHDRFEADNRRLISELGWEAGAWVPPVEEEIGEASFERLDDLWRPRASAAELAMLRRAIAELVDGDRAPALEAAGA